MLLEAAGVVMKIAIFGASGGSGKLLTERCLQAGYRVSALVRTPEKFAYADRVRVIQGSAFDAAPVAETLRGADAVLSALGAKSPFRQEDVLQRAIPVLIRAMQTQGPRRLLAVGSAGALTTSLDRQPAYSRWLAKNLIYKHVLKYPVLEQISQYENLSASGLDWTMVLPPVLTNLPAWGRYRVDGDALPRYGALISRADVADFMMKELVRPRWVKKGVYVAW